MSDRSQGSESSQPITDDTAQDAGAGKVRGSNGRFMPKDDFAQTPGRPKTKTAKKGMYHYLHCLCYDELKPTIHSDDP
jgi:hypothetical protein